jgi:hypothetical protein
MATAPQDEGGSSAEGEGCIVCRIVALDQQGELGILRAEGERYRLNEKLDQAEHWCGKESKQRAQALEELREVEKAKKESKQAYKTQRQRLLDAILTKEPRVMRYVTTCMLQGQVKKLNEQQAAKVIASAEFQEQGREDIDRCKKRARVASLADDNYKCGVKKECDEEQAKANEALRKYTEELERLQIKLTAAKSLLSHDTTLFCATGEPHDFPTLFNMHLH